MEDKQITILQSELDLMVKNITDLTAALSGKFDELDRMAKMSAEWVLKYHAQKIEVLTLKRKVRELEDGGIPS
jgi:hypothetical protein